MKVAVTVIADNFKNLVFQYDDPFADPASVPLYLIAKAWSKDKAVILQSDGGDEFFGGYRRYKVTILVLILEVASTYSHQLTG